MERNKTCDELKKAYHDYKKKKYTFGKYGSKDQIKDAFSDGKIFVLTSSNRGFLALGIPFIIFIAMIIYGFDLFYLIFFISTGTPILFLTIFFKRYYVVIGPSGTYYRKIIRTNCFQWSHVTLAERGIKTIRSRGARVTIAIVKFVLPDGKKISFNSVRYKSLEFVDIVKREMFINLFQIYCGLEEFKYREQYRTDKHIVELENPPIDTNPVPKSSAQIKAEEDDVVAIDDNLHPAIKNPEIYSEMIKEKVKVAKLLMGQNKFEESIKHFRKAKELIKKKYELLEKSIPNRVKEVNETRDIDSLIEQSELKRKGNEDFPPN